MTTLLRLPVLTSLLCLIPIAHAESGDSYLGIDLMNTDYSETALYTQSKLSPTLLQGRIGAYPLENVAVEARLGTSISRDSTQVTVMTYKGWTTTDVEFGINLLAGLYARGELPLVDKTLVLYGIAGFTTLQTEAKAKSGIYTASSKQNGTEFSYGAGFVYKATRELGITTEYMSLVDNSDVKLKTFNVGLTLKY